MVLSKQFPARIAADAAEFIVDVENISGGIGNADDRMLIHRKTLIGQFEPPFFLLLHQNGKQGRQASRSSSAGSVRPDSLCRANGPQPAAAIAEHKFRERMSERIRSFARFSSVELNSRLRVRKLRSTSDCW